MSNLIDKRAALDALRNLYEYNVMSVNAIKAMPTVDAVPVQRCDGCRYADWHSNGCIAYCTKHRTDGHVADGYCSEGKKDDEHEQTKKSE